MNRPGDEIGQLRRAESVGIAGLPAKCAAEDRDLTPATGLCNPGPSAFEWAAYRLVGRGPAPGHHTAQPTKGRDRDMAYRVSTESRGGRTVHTLHDDATGASASILPSFGFNLFDLRLPGGRRGPAGHRRRPPTSPRTRAARPATARRSCSRSRTGSRGGEFTVPGQGRIDLPVNPAPNAIHGFAIGRPLGRGRAPRPTAARPSITGRYQISKNTPEDAAALADRRRPPGPLRARGPPADDDDHRDATRRPTTSPTASASTPTSAAVRARRRPGEDAVVHPRRAKYWVLEDFLPTGEGRPVDDRLDFRKGQPMKGLKLDDVLTGLTFEDDRCVCRLVDQTLRAEFRLGFDRELPGAGRLHPARSRVRSRSSRTPRRPTRSTCGRGVDGGLRRARARAAGDADDRHGNRGLRPDLDVRPGVAPSAWSISGFGHGSRRRGSSMMTDENGEAASRPRCQRLRDAGGQAARVARGRSTAPRGHDHGATRAGEPHDLSGLAASTSSGRRSRSTSRSPTRRAPPPEAVRRRLDWPADVDAATLLSRPPFERAGKGTPGPAAPIYALRLGNRRYPAHEAPDPALAERGRLHALGQHPRPGRWRSTPSAADAQAFRELQAENQRLKEAIEQAWDQAGLPTFLRYLREYIESRKGAPRRRCRDPTARSVRR